MAEDVLLYRTRSYLKKFFGGRDKLYPFLELNTTDMVVWGPWDFISKVDTTFDFGSKLDAGSITGTVASTVNGICRLTTTASNDKYAGIFPNTDGSLEGAAFKGNNSCVVWARVTMDQVATSKVEVGFTDSDTDAGAVNDLAGGTTTANDCAVWVYDTDDSGALFWQGVHSKNTTTASKVEPAKHTPVGATYEWLGVALNGDKVKFMHMDSAGTPDYESAWQASGITGSDSLIPWVFVQARDGTGVLCDIDYWVAWQRRFATDD
ncbi:hypothetical protein LCGC14_1455450 [marine sediment metagenome]|uniref:B30.2/SPRY domain-containing protein n=1 Tax=marine sediment metagenome TaxID=412755 RepID=A0A0F9K2U1_9ZZZZ